MFHAMVALCLGDIDMCKFASLRRCSFLCSCLRLSLVMLCFMYCTTVVAVSFRLVCALCDIALCCSCLLGVADDGRSVDASVVCVFSLLMCGVVVIFILLLIHMCTDVWICCFMSQVIHGSVTLCCCVGVLLVVVMFVVVVECVDVIVVVVVCSLLQLLTE